jgi:hypothetical protein
VANGKARGMQRYLCRVCKRTFGALTGTRLSGLHRKEAWLTFGACLADGDTVKASAERCGVAVSTAFRWRHRFLEAIKTNAARLRGIVEADETFVLATRKGDRGWTRAKKGQSVSGLPDRRPRKRGGKAQKRGLCDEQGPVLVAADLLSLSKGRRDRQHGVAGGHGRGHPRGPGTGAGQGRPVGH